MLCEYVDIVILFIIIEQHPVSFELVEWKLTYSNVANNLKSEDSGVCV
jgi:hypothetical protein